MRRKRKKKEVPVYAPLYRPLGRAPNMQKPHTDVLIKFGGTLGMPKILLKKMSLKKY